MPLFGTTLGAAYYSGQKMTLDATHGAVIIEYDGLATTATVGLSLTNTTAATVGVQNQISPAVEFSATYWDGAATQNTKLAMLYDSRGLDNGQLAFYTSAAGSAYALQSYFAFNYSGVNNETIWFDATGASYVQVQSNAAFIGTNNAWFQSTSLSTQMFSPSHSGYVKCDDSAGTQLAYGLNSFYLDGTNISANISGAGSFLISKSSSSNFKSFLTTTDPSSKTHWGVDVVGLPSLGEISEWNEDWRWMYANNISGQSAGTFVPTNSAGVWNFVITQGTGTSFQVGTPTLTGYPVPVITIVTGTSAVNNINLVSVPWIVDITTLTVQTAVFEFDIAMSSAVLANSLNIYVGLTTGGSPSLGAGANGMWFQKVSGTDTNWTAKTSTGAAISTITGGTGTPPVASTMQCLRIEYYAAGSPWGALVNFYVNNVFIGSTTTNLPNGQLKWFIQANTAATTTSTNVYVGRLRSWCNLFATPFAP